MCTTDYEIINLLLAGGANPNAQNKQGETMLHLVLMHNNYERYNSEVIAKGQDSLETVFQSTSPILLSLLLSYKANPNQPNIIGGKTPLFYVTTPEQTRCLLDAGADTFYKDKRGRTPMDYQIVRNLIQKEMNNKG